MRQGEVTTMQTDSIGGRLATGAAAGLAATLVLQPLRSATASRFPSTKAPMRQEPGKFMVERVGDALPTWASTRIPESVEKVAARSLGLGYGLTFGAGYALVRRQPGNVLIDGAALGLVTWAVGYLGWLSAAKLMPPVTRQPARQVATPILQHVVFGIVAAAVVRGITNTAERLR
jgi:hypothetical protein